MNMDPNTPENLDDIRKKLLGAIPEVKAAAIVSAEGLPIASALPQGVDDTKLAAMTAALLLLSEKAIIEMALGDFEQLYIKASSGYLLCLKAGPRAGLIVSTTSEVRLGLILLDCRRTCEKIDHILQEGFLPRNLFRERRGNIFPAPYIGVPPSPPGDLGTASQVQIHASQEFKDPWENPFCKHCGAFLPEGQSICPSCGNKVI